MGGYKKISKVTGTDIIIIVHTIFIIFGSVIVSIFFIKQIHHFAMSSVSCSHKCLQWGLLIGYRFIMTQQIFEISMCDCVTVLTITSCDLCRNVWLLFRSEPCRSWWRERNGDEVAEKNHKFNVHTVPKLEKIFIFDVNRFLWCGRLWRNSKDWPKKRWECVLSSSRTQNQTDEGSRNGVCLPGRKEGKV